MKTVLLYSLVGFTAQLIDGALGMAYGVSATTFLMSTGVAPALASASVHFAEMFTTAVSGISHLKFGNVDRKLFKQLVLPGVLGGAFGAFMVSSISATVIKPIVSLYLLITGIRILYQAFQEIEHSAVPLTLLALVGGFFDAVGGGGWGPIVTTTLVVNGGTPRKVIGSVNSVEFFVTIAESVVFSITLGSTLTQHWEIIIGLLSGGMLAAPLAAYVCKKLPAKTLMITVGLVITLLSLRTFYIGGF